MPGENMSLEETLTSLTKTIDEALKTGQYKDIPQHLQLAMHEYRSGVLNFLQSRAPKIPSKLKLKLFEALIEDGAEDCVPCVMEMYKTETNLLYLKSMLYQFKNMAYKPVLRFLVKREATMASELHSTYQRVVGHLKGIFREVFYMEEFMAGLENEKKIHHAAKMMIKEPHEDYLPFLHEQVTSKHSVFRVKALEVLRELGTRESLDSLMQLLDDLLQETELSHALIGLLPKLEQPAKKQDDRFIEALVEPLPWDRLTQRGFVIRIRTNTPPGGFEALLDAYQLFSTSLREALLTFLKGVYLGSVEIKTLRKSKILTYLDSHLSHRFEQLNVCLEVMGVLAVKFDLDSFPDTLQAKIPAEYPNRDMIFIRLFSGFKNESSLAFLLDFLERENDPDRMTQIMEILAGYELHDIDEKIIQASGSVDHSAMRKAALTLVSRSDQAPEVFKELLRHTSMVVRVDVLQMISEYYLTACVPMLIELSEEDHANSFLLKLLEAFSKFPGEKTGEVAKRFLEVKYPQMIRMVAMRTMLLSGGIKRFQMLFEAMSHYKEATLKEMAPNLVSLLQENEEHGELSNELAPHCDLWARMLKDFDSEIVMAHLPFLTSLKWFPSEHLETWIKLAREMQKDVIGLELEAKKAISTFVHHLVRTQEEEGEQKNTHRQFEDLLDQMESKHDRLALQAVRNLNSIFRPETIRDYDVGYDRLVETLLAFVERFNDEPQALIQALTVFAKLHDPKLNRRMKSLLHHHIDSVASSARRSLAQSLGLKKGPFHLKRIMVVDDSKFYCMQVVNYLLGLGFKISKAFTPAEGLECLENETVDLLLLDFQMPEMNGIEFIQELRRRLICPSMVVVMTSDQRRELVMSLVEEGVLQVLVKPFKMEELHKKLLDLEVQYQDMTRYLN